MLAKYLGERGAVFTVKGNQLRADFELLLEDRGKPGFREGVDLQHGRDVGSPPDSTTVSTFPASAKLSLRNVTVKKTGKPSKEVGDHTPETATPAQALQPRSPDEQQQPR